MNRPRILFAGSATVAFLLFLVVLLAAWVTVREYHNWPGVEATVISTNVTQDAHSGVFRSKVQLRYVTGGRAYTSSSDYVSYDETLSRAFAAKYAPGSQHKIRVWRAAPMLVMFEERSNLSFRLPVLVICILLFVGVTAIAYVAKRKAW